MRKWVLAGGALLAIAGVAAFIVVRQGPVVVAQTPEDTAQAVAEAPAPGCDLVNRGGLGPTTEVGFFKSYPEPFGSIGDLNVGLPLQAACDTAEAAGFVQTDDTDRYISLWLGANGMPDDTARFTYAVRLSGQAVNPFDGTETRARFHLQASTPLTRSKVEILTAWFDYAGATTHEAWQAQMTAYFGTPSQVAGNGRIYWVISRDRLDPRPPHEVCNGDIVDVTEWHPETPSPRDRLPEHNGIDCQLVVVAYDYVSEGAAPGMISGARIDIFDVAGIAANRRIEAGEVFEMENTPRGQ